MNDLLSQRDELLEAVKAPKRKKKQPMDMSLYLAIIFANIVFLTLDAISALTVLWLTSIPLYGVLTFLAGAIPLVLHESLYTRAYAGDTQRKIAVIGAGTSLLSIVLIGVLAGVINLGGLTANMQITEITLIAILVLIAAFHAILAGVYFYIDDGIRTRQQTAQAIARAVAQGKQIEAGDTILTITERSIAKRKAIGRGTRAAAMDELMKQFTGDDDGDGIPNYRDPDWRGNGRHMTPKFAQETPAIQELETDPTKRQ